MVINICVCVGQEAGSASLPHPWLCLFAPAENLLTVMVVEITSNSYSVREGVGDMHPKTQGTLIPCVLGKGQTKLLHADVILLDLKYVSGQEHLSSSCEAVGTRNTLLYAPKTSVCWSTHWARCFLTKLDAILE